MAMETPHQQTMQGGASTRWVELIVALLIGAIGAVVMADSLRVGISWADDGPRAGYFPFYIGCILVAAGLWIAARTLMSWRDLADKVFASRAELTPVLQMLVPTIVYVALIAYVGIYVASALYIGTFMIWRGKFGWLATALVSIGVPVVLFFLFEIWFLVALPKGPLEHWLGY